MNVSQVIDKLGGRAEAALLLGVSRPLLCRWEIEGIPGKRWKQIATIAEVKGLKELTFEVIASAAPSRAA